MKAKIRIYCEQCDEDLTFDREVLVDTADSPGENQAKIDRVILAHRRDCPYYGKGDKEVAFV